MRRSLQTDSYTHIHSCKGWENWHFNNMSWLISGKNPSITWAEEPLAISCTNDYPFEITTGTFQAPINYYDDSSAKIDIGVYRYLECVKERRAAQPEAALIFLAGGPGVDGRSYEVSPIPRLMEEDKGRIVYFGIDHRGVGTSTKFDLNPNKDYLYDLPRIMQNSPFSPKYLTTQAAALDCALLIKALHDERIASKISLYGFSYGARLAHFVATIVPDLIHSLFVGGICSFGDFDVEDDFSSLWHHCKTDYFCQKYFGPNVSRSFRTILHKITNYKTNRCTKAFFKKFDLQKKRNKGQQLLEIYNLFSFTMHRGTKKAKKGGPFSLTQLVFVFLKITADCNLSEAHYSRVLRTIDNIINFVPNGTENTAYSPLVNHVISMTSYYDFAGGDRRPEIRKPLQHIHDEDYWKLVYWDVWDLYLRPYIAEYTFASEEPLRAPNMEVYVFASLMDLKTPSRPAYKLFEKIEARKKRWIMYGERTHDGYETDCLLIIIYASLLGKELGDIEECIEKDDQSRKLSWSSAYHYLVRKHLDLTNKGPKTWPTSYLPRYVEA